MAISYFLPNIDVIVLGTNYASSRLRCSPKSQPELPMTNANLNKLCPSLVAPVSQFTERFLECNVHTHSYKTSLLHNITNTDMSDILVYLHILVCQSCIVVCCHLFWWLWSVPTGANQFNYLIFHYYSVAIIPYQKHLHEYMNFITCKRISKTIIVYIEHSNFRIQFSNSKLYGYYIKQSLLSQSWNKVLTRHFSHER